MMEIENNRRLGQLILELRANLYRLPMVATTVKLLNSKITVDPKQLLLVVEDQPLPVNMEVVMLVVKLGDQLELASTAAK